MSIILSLLMTMTQLGEHAPEDQATDVLAVFEAALTILERRVPPANYSQ